jgi:para-aminobenzoate synthetase/4-amino-4-deoxychorismate lyase
LKHYPLEGGCLTESMLLKKRKYFLYKQHLDRLEKSAGYFGVPLNRKLVEKMLKVYALALKKRSYKVRLALEEDGGMTVSALRIGRAKRGKKSVAISKIKMDRRDIFLRHKTSHRKIYDREYGNYSGKGFYDVIFFNEKGELTEAHSSNILIKKGKYFYTPPVSCGLLPGTYRAFLLAKGAKYQEKVLHKKDLLSADAVYICNSVRGMRRVYL